MLAIPISLNAFQFWVLDGFLKKADKAKEMDEESDKENDIPIE